ncbi:hypothetical protein MYAM1_004045 [Malassezia yamatoensis]|uniref:Uncharacterized protein n=1 Tax=Malassezia yamatoensis TaxID=253288 RepID=A0AAJ5YWV8_9BASI|nr:hypothetical protein MYAM1_004045 [Malassezia yamatoensis]
MYQRFRWTPKNTPSLIIFGLVIPGAAMYYFSQTTNKWDWTGKTKEDTLVKQSPEAKAKQ